MTTLDGLDALVFTGGIGEHAATIRSRICERLRPIGIPAPALDEPIEGVDARTQSGPAVLVVHAREDVVIADAAARRRKTMKSGPIGHGAGDRVSPATHARFLTGRQRSLKVNDQGLWGFATMRHPDRRAGPRSPTTRAPEGPGPSWYQRQRPAFLRSLAQLARRGRTQRAAADRASASELRRTRNTSSPRTSTAAAAGRTRTRCPGSRPPAMALATRWVFPYCEPKTHQDVHVWSPMRTAWGTRSDLFYGASRPDARAIRPEPVGHQNARRRPGPTGRS